MGKKMKEANKILAAGRFVVPSPEEVAAAASFRGVSGDMAWTAKTLAVWGISWPPRRGWRSELRERWETAQRQLENVT